MIGSFAGKVALVTGSSSGIGEAVIRRMASLGADVVVHYNSNRDGAEAVAADIRAMGARAHVFGGDVADPAVAQGLIESTVAAFGRIDMLVNNAGEWYYGALGEIALEDAERQFRVSTLAVLDMIQRSLPHFPDSGGAIVNVVTNLALDPTPGTIIYAASRAAAMSMTAGFARECGARNIAINAVAPGPTQTKMALVRGTDERRRYVAKRTPFGRYGHVDDIANVVVFLASAEAHWVTGQTILADGGYTQGYY